MKKNTKTKAQQKKIAATKARKEHREQGTGAPKAVTSDSVLFINADTSILDRTDLVIASKKGKNIGVTTMGTCAIFDGKEKIYRKTALDLRMAQLGDIVQDFLVNLSPKLFPIINGEFGEVYSGPSDTNLFHRFYGYLFETIYMIAAAAEIGRFHKTSHEEEDCVWSYIANDIESLFPGFLDDEYCKTAA